MNLKKVKNNSPLEEMSVNFSNSVFQFLFSQIHLESMPVLSLSSQQTLLREHVIFPRTLNTGYRMNRHPNLKPTLDGPHTAMACYIFNMLLGSSHEYFRADLAYLWFCFS